jgi:hypothetical protein
MKTGIVSTFVVSITCFVLTYLTLDEGYLGLLFLGIGVVLAGCGIYLTANSQKS